MRWLLLFPLLVPMAGAAQEAPAAAPAAAPARPRLKAAKPTGPSLAPGRDEDFEEVAPPRDADAVPVADDPTLLRATLWAFEPAPREVRILAIEDLGLLGDARLLNALAHLIYDPDLAAQLAAVRAIRAIRHPRAEEILQNVVRHPTLPAALKQLALESVIFQNTRSALVFIWNIGHNPQWGATLHGVARRLLLEVPKDAWATPTTSEQPT
jgi:hypothetical protein